MTPTATPATSNSSAGSAGAPIGSRTTPDGRCPRSAGAEELLDHDRELIEVMFEESIASVIERPRG